MFPALLGSTRVPMESTVNRSLSRRGPISHRLDRQICCFLLVFWEFYQSLFSTCVRFVSLNTSTL